MARRIHDPGAMPEGRAPPAPIFVRAVGIEDEPAALHLRIPQLLAAATRHLLLIERQIHVFRRIAVQIVNGSPPHKDIPVGHQVILDYAGPDARITVIPVTPRHGGE